MFASSPLCCNHLTHCLTKLYEHIFGRRKCFRHIRECDTSFKKFQHTMRLQNDWKRERRLSSELRGAAGGLTCEEEMTNLKREPKWRIVTLQPLASMCHCVTQFSFPSRIRWALHRLHGAQISVVGSKDGSKRESQQRCLCLAFRFSTWNRFLLSAISGKWSII